MSGGVPLHVTRPVDESPDTGDSAALVDADALDWRSTDDAVWTLHNDTETARAGRSMVARRFNHGPHRVALSLHEDAQDAGGVVLLSEPPWSDHVTGHTVLTGQRAQRAGVTMTLLDLGGEPQLVIPVTEGPYHALVWVPVEHATDGPLERYPAVPVPMDLGAIGQGLHAADLTGDGVEELLITMKGEDATGVLVVDAATAQREPTDGVIWNVTLRSSLAHRESFASGDIDGDGVADAVLGDMSRGSPSPHGAVDVVLGGPLSARSLPNDSDFTVNHTGHGGFGMAVALADVDGDGALT